MRGEIGYSTLPTGAALIPGVGAAGPVGV